MINLLQTTYLDPGIVSAESSLCATIHWGYTCVFWFVASITNIKITAIFANIKGELSILESCRYQWPLDLRDYPICWLSCILPSTAFIIECGLLVRVLAYRTHSLGCEKIQLVHSRPFRCFKDSPSQLVHSRPFRCFKDSPSRARSGLHRQRRCLNLTAHFVHRREFVSNLIVKMGVLDQWSAIVRRPECTYYAS